ncbi:phosphotransferase [Bibersteinia trehalosi USDA-ARS-USMARC-189]|uniref:Phosphotransferase n=2 Tax=Bibersteinia trehalosi TaxID=47735 RepID=W0RD46_BIBTR|nr:PTS mannose transporter subunit IIAB [Bibersteinia trehalosi]AHG83103.1 phosphotransferase [Bibersteinia trehalosi USDA-ARS-USMARC-189]AHG87308.1 phosphotransferase [Bibersteinia trehalosi USDA-ARS-USMARC-190]
MKISDLELFTINGRKVTILESKSGLGIGGAIIEGIGEVNASVMSYAEGKNVIKNAQNLNDERRAKIKPEYIYDAISFTKPMNAVAVFDYDSSEKLRAFRRAEHEAKVANAKKELEAKELELGARYEGITELRNAISSWDLYREKFQAAMEDEYNDGANMPKRPNSNLEELHNKYPLASIYLKAESYTFSENHHKFSAGKKAMALLDNGGSAEEANAILDNWLPETALWD